MLDTTAQLIRATVDVITTGTVVWGSVTLARLYISAIDRRPRHCSCLHGPGYHGPNGCTGREVTGGRIYDCRCTGFDAAGPRVQR